jgi:uncharacterized metal-binding protein YceD (DUF177 family)
MRVVVNLRHLEEGTVRLEGEAAPADLELDGFKDELVEVTDALRYDLEVEKQNENLYVHGKLAMPLICRCKRCLKEFKHDFELNPYHLYVPLEGEDAATVSNDLVDLAPYIREDMLLAFPQHPLCSENCAGLANVSGPKTAGSDKSPQGSKDASAWSALDKLKF